MKKTLLFMLPLLLLGLSPALCAQECTILEQKVNLNDLESKDGLYYQGDKLYSGSFYSLYRTDGIANNTYNAYAEGSLVNGQRDGIWRWYSNNSLHHQMIYCAGVRSNKKGDNFRVIKGKKYLIVN